jgi:hypothetical protein
MTAAKAWLRLDGADPINQGLAGWWPHDEAAGGRIRDLSPFARNASNPLSRAFGITGRYAVYAGTGTQVRSGRILSGLPNWSIVARFRNTMANNSGGHAIYAERAASGNDILKLDFGSGSAPNGAEVIIRNTAGTLLLGTPSTTVVNDGQWHTVIATLNGTAVLLFTDGRLESTSTWSGGNTFTNSGVASTIGSDLGDLNANYTGDMSHVRIWARTLSLGEVQRISRDPWAGTARRHRAVVYNPSLPLSAEITGTVEITASVAASLALDATIAGTVDVTASVAATTTLDAEIAGTVPITADISARLDRLAEIAGTIPITASITAFMEGGAGDTHDGFLRRSRRQRALDAAERRRDAERLADARALRLELEAALGMAADAVEEAPAPAVEAVREAVAVVRALPPVAPAIDFAAARAAVSDLLAAIEAARRAKALADDDEDVEILLRAL